MVKQDRYAAIPVGELESCYLFDHRHQDLVPSSLVVASSKPVPLSPAV